MMRSLLAALVVLMLIPAGADAQWTVRTHTDEFTGDVSHYAIARGTGGNYQGFGTPPHVGLQCDRRGAVLYFETHDNFLQSGGEFIGGMVKVDDRSTRRVRFAANGEGTGGRIIDTSSDRGFWQLIREIRAGHELKLRVHDFRGVSYDYRFPLAGSTRATNALTCFRRGLQTQAERQREASERERAVRETPTPAPGARFSRSEAREIAARTAGVSVGDVVDIATCDLDVFVQLRAQPSWDASGQKVPRSNVCSFGAPSAEVLEIETDTDGLSWFRVHMDGADDREGWVPAAHVRPG